MDTFNPRDLISLAKYKWGSGATGTYNQDWFKSAADTVRSNLGVTNYGKDVSLDPTFDYNKVDWGSVSSQLNDWQANGTEQQKAVANLYIPMMTNLGVTKDRGIYYAADLQSQATNLTNQGVIDAQRAQAESALQNPGHANTIAFYDKAKSEAITSLTEQAALLKKQAEADYASGREQIEADYSGVEQDILASVAKLQQMSGDEFAARGMAFSGSLNQAVADIAAAGASELAKSMAQKGAQLGKLTQELVKYTAQIDLDTLNNKTEAVLQYGLQMAALMDDDAQVKSQAEAILAGLDAQQKTQEQLAPITQELGRAQAEGEYATAQNEAAQQNFENSLKLSQLGLDEQKQALAEQESNRKYQLAYDQLGLDQQRLVLDEMYKKGVLSIGQYEAATGRMNAGTSAYNAETSRINSTLKAQEQQQSDNLTNGTYDPKLDLQIVNNDQTPDDVYNAAQLRLSIGTGSAFTNDSTFAAVLKGMPEQKTAEGMVAASPGLLDYTEEEAAKLLNLMDGNPVRQLEALVLWTLANNKGTTFGEAWQGALADNTFDEDAKAAAGSYFVNLAGGRTDDANWSAILQQQFGRAGAGARITTLPGVPRVFPSLLGGE